MVAKPPPALRSFLDKMIEWVVVKQLRWFLDDTQYLDPFHSGFRPSYDTETALDLRRDLNKRTATLLNLLNLSYYQPWYPSEAHVGSTVLR